MSKPWIIFLVLIVVAGLLLIGLRFFSGDEDTWLCSGGQWVKHGNPSAPMPTTKC
ncbi:MAG: hypothetical protein V1826_01115 [bacterium]